MKRCCHVCSPFLLFGIFLLVANNVIQIFRFVDESDIRVPFYMRGPGIMPNTIILNMTANVDITPTLLDLAGIAIPHLVDGHSLVPLLKGQPSSRPWRTSFISEFAEGGVQQWGTNGMWKLTTGSGGGGSGDPSINPATVMPGIDIYGDNDATPCPPGTPNATACQTKCASAAKSGLWPCEGWTHHFNGGSGPKSGWRCCMKTHITGLHHVAQNPPLVSGCLDPVTVNKSIHGGGNSTYGDGQVKPPFGPANCTSPKNRICQYQYDDPTNQWRMLRVINETHNFAFMEWDPDYVFSIVAHSEYYDMTGTVSDPTYNFEHLGWWQMENQFASLPASTQKSLHSELQAYYECQGTVGSSSNCP